MQKQSLHLPETCNSFSLLIKFTSYKTNVGKHIDMGVSLSLSIRSEDSMASYFGSTPLTPFSGNRFSLLHSIPDLSHQNLTLKNIQAV